tara:strand:+ start:2075 stop:2218 length:144 start_codon:yes stop_codon:yes gene_type:complete
MFAPEDDLSAGNFFNNSLKVRMNLIGFLNRNQPQFFGVRCVGAVPEF